MNEELRKELGKIKAAHFGHGGYQGECLGLHVTFGGSAWGCGANKSFWDFELVECSKYSQWTEKDREKQAVEVLRYVSKLLKDAKVDSVEKLIGLPIEAEFDGNTLKNWRILTEVL